MKIFFTSKSKSEPPMVLDYNESFYKNLAKSGDLAEETLKKLDRRTCQKIANVKIDVFENSDHELSFAVSIKELNKQVKPDDSGPFSSFSFYKSANDVDNESEEKIRDLSHPPKNNQKSPNDLLESPRNGLFFPDEKKKSEGQIVVEKLEKIPYYPAKNEKQKCQSKSPKVLETKKEKPEIKTLTTLGKREKICKQEGRVVLPKKILTFFKKKLFF